MSIQRPGEADDRIAELVSELDEVSDERVLAESEGLVRHFDSHPRTARGHVLRLWKLELEAAENLVNATEALAKKGLADFQRDVAAALTKATPAKRKRLVEALTEVAENIYDDDTLQAGLRAMLVEQQAATPAERLVLGLSLAVEASDDKGIAAAVKAVAAARGTLQVPPSMLSQLVDRIGQLGQPRELALIGSVVEQLGFKGKLLERVLAQTIGGAQMTKAVAVEKSLLALVPKKITWEILAYNLACNAALHQDKPRLLEMTKVALGLGKEKSQFMADSDFDPFKKDPDFLKVFTAQR